MKIFLFLSLLSLSLLGCTSVHLKHKIIATNSSATTKTQPLVNLQRTEIKTCDHILWVVRLKKADSVDLAIEKLIKMTPGANALKDVEVQTTIELFTVLYNISCWRVSGIPTQYVAEGIKK